MDTFRIRQKGALLISIAFFVPFVLISILNNTTGDTGDSIVHYLYSRDCWEHVEYLFNLWAKPLFTLVSSPFSQFGMTGMKVFNSLVVAITLYVSMLISIRLKLEYWYLVPFIIVFSPFFGVHIFSGLTEFFYALLLVVSIYLILKEKLTWAAIVCGFLPFARNEGILPIFLMAVYFVSIRKLRYLPYLAIGHLVIAILGKVVMGYPLHWTVTTHVYDPTGSSYGKGDFFTFVKHIRYVMGWPNVFLLILGHLMAFKLLREFIKGMNNARVWVILIFGNFLGFYLGHALLYEFGRFNSMGLPRVLHSVVPLAAIISAYGVSQLLTYFQWKRKWILSVFLISLIAYYPFISRPGAHIWSKSVLTLPENEFVDHRFMSFLHSYGFDAERLYFNYPYFGEVTEADALRQIDQSPFMNKEKIELLESGDLYIWDHWFSVVEGGITKDFLLQQGFAEIHCDGDEYWKWEFEFCLFRKD